VGPDTLTNLGGKGGNRRGNHQKSSEKGEGKGEEIGEKFNGEGFAKKEGVNRETAWSKRRNGKTAVANRRENKKKA